jgi:hypothetical protein
MQTTWGVRKEAEEYADQTVKTLGERWRADVLKTSDVPETRWSVHFSKKFPEGHELLIVPAAGPDFGKWWGSVRIAWAEECVSKVGDTPQAAFLAAVADEEEHTKNEIRVLEVRLEWLKEIQNEVKK